MLYTNTHTAEANNQHNVHTHLCRTHLGSVGQEDRKEKV